MQVVITPLLKYKSKDPADVNNCRKIVRLARYMWTADSQFGFKQAYGTEMAIFALKQTVDFSCDRAYLLFVLS